MEITWFRLYAEAVDDEKLRLLAFEDRWHFVALLCCKAKGILDDSPKLMHRKVAVKLGIDLKTLDEVARRLSEVGLIDEKTLQPLSWDERQFISDSSTERVRAYRERRKKERNVTCNATRNVSVTAQDTETETETETERSTPLARSDADVTRSDQPELALADARASPPAAASPLSSAFEIPIPIVGGEYRVPPDYAGELGRCFPAVDVDQTLREIRAWNLANPARRKTKNGIKRHITQWFQRVQDG
jgi:hypothetical protein